MIDLSTLTHEDVDELLAAENWDNPCCHRRGTASNWWLVTSTDDTLYGCGINCDHCVRWWDDDENYGPGERKRLGIQITRVETRDQRAVREARCARAARGFAVAFRN